MEQRFSNKVAAVTGAASGIGFGIAKRLAAEGAHVAILDIQGACEAAKEVGENATGRTVDVTDHLAVESAFRSIVDEFGGLHVLVNNAGIDGVISPLADYPVDAFHRVVSVNLSGVFFGMRYAIPHLIAAGGGSIVNISSAAAVKSISGITPYAATKAAVVRMTQATAIEYAAQGVRVNVVLPGVIETPLMRQVFEASPEIRDSLTAQTPVGRFGTPDELAATVAFLASDEAAFVTGVSVPTDGGYTAT
jgi:NAD(P)-dependent dehydrogenase (short-subunit alcohol dehydrogenase family)